MEGIRVGLSCVMKRFVETNNKYMMNYCPTKESSYLVNVDANKLNGDVCHLSYLIKHLNGVQSLTKSPPAVFKGFYTLNFNGF